MINLDNLSWICDVQSTIKCFGGASSPKPPPITPPGPMPVPASANNAQLQQAQAQTIAATQVASGRESTDLVKAQGTTLGG